MIRIFYGGKSSLTISLGVIFVKGFGGGTLSPRRIKFQTDILSTLLTAPQAPWDLLVTHQGLYPQCERLCFKRHAYTMLISCWSFYYPCLTVVPKVS